MTLEFVDFSISVSGKPLFTGLNAILPKGQNLAVLGCNGAGKSSLLQTIAGFEKSYGGIMSNKIGDASYLPQNSELRRDIPISVREFIAFAELLNPKISRATIDATLEDFHLTQIANQKISNISGGQLMLARLARIDLENMPLILLDEPFAPLDNEKSNVLIKAIEKWKSENRCAIVTIHDEKLSDGFDHFLTLENGCAFWELRNPHHNHNCKFAHRDENNYQNALYS